MSNVSKLSESSTQPTGAPRNDIRERILGCARKVMLDHGASAFSVRKVAIRANMSLGHVQHYFPDRYSLLAALLAQIRNTFNDHYVHVIRLLEDPAERYLACARFVIDSGPDERMHVILREFWTLAARDVRLGKLLASFYAESRRLAANILCELHPDLDRGNANRRAATSIAMLSGAFLNLEHWSESLPRRQFREHLLNSLARLAFEPPAAA